MNALLTVGGASMMASLSSQVTGYVAHHGVLAVFVLMAIDALLPVGGELIMLYAGVVAAGAVAGQHAALFGTALATGTESYIVLASAGSLGYLAGSLVGWGVGVRGGRPVVERYGRWLHISPSTFRRAEHWFERFGLRAVFFARITPVVRSFISIPAGVLGSPLAPYTLLTLIGSLVWCFAFAGVGWALGGQWENFHRSFRYADYTAIALLLALAGAVLLHRRRQSNASS